MSLPIKRVLITFVVLSLIGISFLATYITQSLFIISTFFFISKEKRYDTCGRIFRTLSYFFVVVLNPFWHMHYLNSHPKVNNSKCIVMMNHLSGADPFVTCGVLLPSDGSWIGKSELFRYPIVGALLSNADDLRVEFKNKKAGLDVVKGTVGLMMEAAKTKLRRGRKICVYPEGVRNPHPDGDLAEFKLGFFRLAIEEKAAILPIAVSGTDKLWRPRAKLVRSGHAYVSFLDPIDASEFTDPQELATHVRSLISAQRNSHPDRAKVN